MPTAVGPVISTLSCSVTHVSVASCLIIARSTPRPVVGVDVFEARLRDLQLSVLEQPSESAIVASKVLGVDEEREAPVEGERAYLRIALLCLPRLGHRAESEGDEFLHRWFFQHVVSFLQWK